MARQTIRDVSVFTVGGTDFLCSLPKAELTINNVLADGATACSKSNTPQVVKKGASVSFDLLSSTAIGMVSNLNVTAMTIGATSYLVDLVEGSCSIGYVTDADTSGTGDTWQAPQNIRLGDVGFDMTFKVNTSAAPAFVLLGASSTLADAYMDVSITIGTATITMPCVLETVVYSVEKDSVQEVKATFKLRDDGDSNIPNAPTGSATLLAAAFNAYRTALALVWTTKTTGGLTFGGNFIFNSVSFSFGSSSIIAISYNMSATGAITAVAT